MSCPWYSNIQFGDNYYYSGRRQQRKEATCLVTDVNLCLTKCHAGLQIFVVRSFLVRRVAHVARPVGVALGRARARLAVPAGSSFARHVYDLLNTD